MEHHESLSTRDLAPTGSAVEEVGDPGRQAEPARSAATERASGQADEPPRPEVSPTEEQREAGGDTPEADMQNGSGQPVSAAGERDDGQPLLSEELGASYQLRWEEIQTRFVDEPRGAVKDADGLVAKLMQQLAEGFAQERDRLEAQWDRGEDISTEELRVALTRYRSFFQRLLAT